MERTPPKVRSNRRVSTRFTKTGCRRDRQPVDNAYAGLCQHWLITNVRMKGVGRCDHGGGAGVAPAIEGGQSSNFPPFRSNSVLEFVQLRPSL